MRERRRGREKRQGDGAGRRGGEKRGGRDKGIGEIREGKD